MSAAELSALRPARRTDLRIGPPTLRGTVELRPVLDPVGGGRFELRAKEYFVLERLDGRTTLDEAGQAYAARFGTRLGEAHWRQLLTLLYGRGLLVAGHPGAAARPARAPGAPAGEPAAGPRSTLLAGRQRMVADAGAFTERLHRRTAFARTRWFLTVLAVACAGMLAQLALRAGMVWHDAGQLFQRPVLVLAVGVVLWVSLGVHEIAHGLVGRAFGGTVTEIGLRWRLPMTYLYCVVKDVPFFARRGHQVATVLAGPAANIVFLLPFWVVWNVLPATDPGHFATGGLLLLGVATAVGNLLPLPPLDGYKALGYATGTSRTASDSRAFWRLALAALVRRGPGTGGYPRRARWVYGVYGAFSSALTAAAAAGLLVWSGRWLADRWGIAAGFLPLLLVVAAFALRRLGMTARARREALAARRAAA